MYSLYSTFIYINFSVCGIYVLALFPMVKIFIFSEYTISCLEV